MNGIITALFLTDDSLAQQYVAQCVCAYHAGGLESLASLGTMEGSKTDDNSDDTSASEVAYCSLMASSHGGVLEVSPERARGAARFMREARGMLKELSRAIIVISSSEESQQQGIGLMDMLSPALEAGQLRTMLVECPPEVSPEVAYERVFDHMRERQTVTPEEEPVLYAARAFQNAHDHKLDFASLLHGVIDVESEFVLAREQGASAKRLRNLARRVMAARSVVAMVPEYRRAFDSLGLNRISTEEWQTRRGVIAGRSASGS